VVVLKLSIAVTVRVALDACKHLDSD
jgi:hypothetical protein